MEMMCIKNEEEKWFGKAREIKVMWKRGMLRICGHLINKWYLTKKENYRIMIDRRERWGDIQPKDENHKK